MTEPRRCTLYPSRLARRAIVTIHDLSKHADLPSNSRTLGYFFAAGFQFVREEISYQELEAMHAHVVENLQQPSIVIDTADLLDDPGTGSRLRALTPAENVEQNTSVKIDFGVESK